MISACGTGWFVGLLPTSTTSTSGGRRSSSGVAPSRSVTTTSAPAERLEPGQRDEPRVAGAAADEDDPPPSGTAPAQVDLPQATSTARASRTPAARRGSGSPHRHDAEDEVAVGARRRRCEPFPSRPSEALTHQVRRACAQAATCAVDGRVGRRSHDEPGPLLDVGLLDGSLDEIRLPSGGEPAGVRYPGSGRRARRWRRPRAQPAWSWRSRRPRRRRRARGGR